MRTVIKLVAMAKKYWKYMIIGMIAIIVLTGCQLTAPMIVRELTSLIQNRDPDLGQKALRLAIFLAVIYLVQAGCTFLRSYITHYAAWNFVSDMRVRIYNHLQKLSLRYYHDKQTGQIMSRASNDVQLIELLIAHAVPDLIVNVLILLGVTVLLFSINVVLALLSLVTVPFLIFAITVFAKKIQPQFRTSQQRLAEFNATLHDNLSGIKEIQAFNQHEREKCRIWKSSKAHVNQVLRALRLSAIYHPTIEFFNHMGTVLVIGFGGYLASLNRVPLPDIIAFILLLNMFYQPISTLGRVNEDLQNALAGASRVFEVLDTEPDVKEKSGAINVGRLSGRIDLENVSFNYISHHDVLKDISLSIKPGELVAIVGPTGVGKTTLISLLARFYDPDDGKIMFDGIDIKDITLSSLRENISIVLQDVFLFNGTVAENISYGVKNAGMDDIVKAAKIANAHEFICEMEDGYDTVIGERGIKLSGGQKQRLSIARAVLRDTPILILDEATASVDMKTEKLIHKAIDSVIQNRTTIMIAHRLSSIRKADNIIVLDEGKIAEIGTHDELMKTGGIYKRLCEIQMHG